MRAPGRLPVGGPALALGRRGAVDVPEHGARGSTIAVCASVFCRPREGLQHGWASYRRAPEQAHRGLRGDGARLLYIPIEVSAPAMEQALQAVPRRLSNPMAEVEALFAGGAESAGEAKEDGAYNDEYAGEGLSLRLD